MAILTNFTVGYMIKNTSAILLIIIILISCAGQSNKNTFTPEHDHGVAESEKFIDVLNIIETIDGAGNNSLPNWVNTYINGGIYAIERLETFNNKYVFLAVNRGTNFNVLNKWAENYSAVYDFPKLAASRIENKMISSSSRFPDDEYGLFFEAMVKNAYSAEYPGAVKEEVYWLKVWFENENTFEYTENYVFFVFISIEKNAMNSIIRNMINRTSAAVTVTNAQSSAINRLRQSFFEGF